MSSETNLTMNRIKQTVGADHLLTSALCKRHRRQECSRFASTTKRGFVALLILLALGVPASAQDPIAEWLKQDEVEGQIDEVRPDLNALTDQQLQEMFRIGREQADSPQLIERGGEDHKSVVYIWLIAIAVSIAAIMAAVKARPFVRSQLIPILRLSDRLLPSRVARWT